MHLMERFKAFRGIPESVDGFARSDAPAFLVDASVKGVYGGSGVTADWNGAAELAKKYPLLLAGGLTPENVAEAVAESSRGVWMWLRVWNQLRVRKMRAR
jgi:phosphoribosylanthranilate isomerase